MKEFPFYRIFDKRLKLSAKYSMDIFFAKKCIFDFFLIKERERVIRKRAKEWGELAKVEREAQKQG